VKFSFDNKVIYIISPEDWWKNLLSKHLFAIELASRGNEVYFLGPGFRPDRPFLEPIRGIPNLKIINYQLKSRGLRWFPKQIARLMMKKDIRAIEKLIGKPADVIWSFDNSRYFFLDLFDAQLKIAHIMDHNMDFQIENQCRTADICFGVTTDVVSRLHALNPKSYFIQHGVVPVNADDLKKHSNEVHAVYAGNLMIPYINWSLVRKLVSTYSDVKFTFCGSYETDNLNNQLNRTALDHIQALEKLNNVSFIGALGKEELHKTLTDGDVLLLFYDHNLYPKQVANSHKILEYLSSGNVVVANFTAEYHGLDLLEMAQTDEDYLDLFNKVIQDISKYNSPELREKRIKYALEHTYPLTIKNIEHLIDTNVN
jgi:hypothetical protein